MSRPDDPRQKDVHDDTSDGELHDSTISQLYRQLPDESPRQATDEAILAAARRAVSAGPRKPGFSPALQRLTASAAVFVLGIALVVQWQYREPDQLADVLATSSGNALPERMSQAESPSSPAEQPADSATTAPTTAPTTTTAEKKKSAEMKMAQQVARALKQEKAEEQDGEQNPPLPVTPVPAAAPPVSALAAEHASRLSARRERNALQEESFMAAPASAFAPAPSVDTMISRPLANTELHEQEKSLMPGLLPYQRAMQMREWQSALDLMPPVTGKTPYSQQVDRDLLGQLLGEKQKPACMKPSQRNSGPDFLLCQLLEKHAGGNALAADTLQQLHDAGLMSGALEYRREALRELTISGKIQ